MIQKRPFNSPRQLLVVLFLSAFIPLFAQKDILKKANEMYQQERYHETLIYLQQWTEVERSGPLLLKRAVCYYHTNKLDKALADLHKAIQYKYKNKEIEYYLGRIFHDKGRFEKAAVHYKKYLNTLHPTDDMYSQVIQRIAQCGSAIDLSYRQPIAKIKNLGAPINTIYNEINWIKSPNDKGYYYTTDRPQSVTDMSAIHHEIYRVERDSTQRWTVPIQMDYPVNTDNEERMIGISQDGEGLLFYQLGEQTSQYLEHRQGSVMGGLREIDLPYVSSVDAEVFFYSDSIVFFAAELPAGYGGLDLYVTYFKEGQWAAPHNLGPSVNSSYDEKAPYLVHEGDILYFSSNRAESIGGYDVFRSQYLYESQKWSKSQNLGFPINSPGDDLHFKLADDGMKAYISSDRKSSIGGFDIYELQFFEKMYGQDTYAGYLPMSNPAHDHERTAYATAAEEEYVGGTTESASQEYIISPIYYDDDKSLVNKINKNKLKPIIDLLQADSQASIELIAHNYNAGPLEQSLCKAYDSAEKVRNYLMKKGIEKHRIRITGLGDQYPLIKDDDEHIATRYNNRINIKIHKASSSSSITYDDIRVDSFLKRPDYELFRAIIDESISYKIEIANVREEYKGFTLDQFNDVAIELDTITGWRSYTIGLYQALSKVIKTKQHLEAKGIRGLKIIPYHDGLRLSQEEIIRYSTDFPE